MPVAGATSAVAAHLATTDDDEDLDEVTEERWPLSSKHRLFDDDDDDELDAAEYDELVVAEETGEYDAAAARARRRSVNAHVVARGRTYADNNVVTAVRRYAVQVLTERRRRTDDAVTAVSAPSMRKRRLATGSQPPPPAAPIARHVIPRSSVMTARLPRPATTATRPTTTALQPQSRTAPTRPSTVQQSTTASTRPTTTALRPQPTMASKPTTTALRPSMSPAPEPIATARTARVPAAVPLQVKPAASERMAAPEPIATAPTVPSVAEQIQVAMRWSDIAEVAPDLAGAEPIAAPAWAALDPRIAKMIPEGGRIERIAEHAVLEGRIVTRGMELVIGQIDPMVAIEKLGAAIVDARMHLEIDDNGVGATSPELIVRGRGEEQLELLFQLVGEHDDVDLREDLARCPELASLLPLAELGRFVTRVASGQQLGRRPHAAMSIALDDETRACVLAWLAAREYEQDGATWRRVDGDLEYAVTFERSVELGVDEATAFVRARRSAQ